MSIAMTVSNYLDEHGIDYDILSHPHTVTSGQSAAAAHIPGTRLAKSVLLEDDSGHLMLATESELANLFSDCEIGALPALGPAYGIETVVDDAIAEQPDIYFEAGDHEQLVHVSAESFNALLGETARHGHFSH